MLEISGRRNLLCWVGWDCFREEKETWGGRSALSLTRFDFWRCYRLSAMCIAWVLIQIPSLGVHAHFGYALFVSAENEDLSFWWFSCLSVTWHSHWFSSLQHCKKANNLES